MTEDLLFALEDGIGRVIFNRPSARNALTFAMYDRLAEICTAAGTDRAMRVLVIAGTGSEAFAAGTDISLFRDFATAQDALDYEARLDRTVESVERCGVPTIAAIAGACTGGGAAIAAACDLRIASANLRFGFPVARTLGNCLSLANLARLAALVGAARIKDMMLTARLIAAEEAHAMGLVSEVLPDAAALAARATALAGIVAANAPLTLKATKEGLLRLSPPLPDGGEDLIRMCYMSRDFREGMTAFLEKRPARFTGE